MRDYTPIKALSVCLAFLATAGALAGQDLQERLPDAETVSASGLQLICHMQKTNFAVGQPVNIWCIVSNTTDATLFIKCGPDFGPHLTLARSQATWNVGIQPSVVFQSEEPLQTTGSPPDMALLLPAHSSLPLLLTYKADRPQHFAGIVAYSPDVRGGGFFGTLAFDPHTHTGVFVCDEFEKARQACAFSNPVEYDITKAAEKSAAAPQ